jgi:hypothetical protein
MDACCCFSCIARIFCNPHAIHFGTIVNSLLRKRVSVNKIMMRLVKLCMQKTDKTNCIIRHGTLVRAIVMAMGLLYRLALWSVYVCGLWIQ